MVINGVFIYFWGGKKHDGIGTVSFHDDHQYADCLSVLIIIARYQARTQNVWEEEEGIGIFLLLYYLLCTRGFIFPSFTRKTDDGSATR